MLAPVQSKARKLRRLYNDRVSHAPSLTTSESRRVQPNRLGAVRAPIRRHEFPPLEIHIDRGARHFKLHANRAPVASGPRKGRSAHALNDMCAHVCGAAVRGATVAGEGARRACHWREAGRGTSWHCLDSSKLSVPGRYQDSPKLSLLCQDDTGPASNWQTPLPTPLQVTTPRVHQGADTTHIHRDRGRPRGQVGAAWSASPPFDGSPRRASSSLGNMEGNIIITWHETKQETWPPHPCAGGSPRVDCSPPTRFGAAWSPRFLARLPSTPAKRKEQLA